MTKVNKKRKYVRKNIVAKAAPVKTKKKRKYVRKNKGLEQIAGQSVSVAHTSYTNDAGPATPDDPVNHPSHYTSHKSGVECIQITEHLNFCLGSAIKYIWRSGQKGSEIQDLEKAVWYLNREIERLKTS